MISIEKLKNKEIRKIVELVNDDGTIEEIIIKNPNKKVRNEFVSVMSEASKNDDGFTQIEYLMKELTNIEMTIPLSEFLQSEYINPAINDVLKELANILFELVKELSYTLEVEAGMDEAQSLLSSKIKNDIQ